MVNALRKRRRSIDDSGVTLVELLITMTIFSTVLSVVYGILISVQKQTADTIRRADSVDQARLALSQLDRQVRSGNVLYNPIAETLPMSMRVYTQANDAQRCVQWQIEPITHVLRTRSWTTTWQSDGVVSDWLITARNVVNTTADSPLPFALQGSTTVYGSRLVDVRILVKDARQGGKPVEVTTSLSGRNTLYGYDPGVCSPVPPAA